MKTHILNKKLFFGLILTSLLSLAPAHARDGGETGGGGGGIKIGDKVYTMAQAGLQFPKDPEPFYVDFESIDKATEILKSLEKHCPKEYLQNIKCIAKPADINKRILFNRHEYKKVEVADAQLFERLKAEYQKYVSQLPVRGSFVLPAYTEDKITYLFPDFFKADTQTQAIYLIHEALFYNYDIEGLFASEALSLEQVLKIEVAIVGILKNENPSTVRALRDALAPFHDYKGHKEAIIVGNYLEYLKEKGITVSFDQLFQDTDRYLDDRISCPRRAPERSNNFKDNAVAIETSPYSLSKNRSIDADFFKTFFHTALNFQCIQDDDKNNSRFHYQLSDLEFRGSQIYSKSTGEPATGVYLTHLGFFKIAQ